MIREMAKEFAEFLKPIFISEQLALSSLERSQVSRWSVAWTCPNALN
jgi:hypothetical protein